MRKLAIFCVAFAVAAAVYVWLLPPTAALILGALLLVGGILLFFFPRKGMEKYEKARKRCRIAALGLTKVDRKSVV